MYLIVKGGVYLMKKLLIITFSMNFFMILTGVNRIYAIISGSSHDFSAESWSGGQICEPCHIPHLASENPYTPLWGHDTTQVNYQDNLVTFYGTTWGSVNGPTLMCLSCHDGTVALDSFGGNIGTEFIDPEFDNIETNADIECGSCHDVHNSTNIENLLWISNSGSALCLTCHNK